MNSEHSRELVERLAKRLVGGDRDALGELVARMAPHIRGQVQRRAPREALERESVDDLAQSVCRDVLERIDRGAFEYRGEAEFRAWLARAVDWKLGQRWRRAHLANSQTTPSGAFARGEDRRRFAELIERLSPADRSIVVGVHVEGRSHADLANELGITESHSRTRLARALARLATWTSDGVN